MRRAASALLAATLAGGCASGPGLFSGAGDERDLAAKLRACDCELLLDRTYFLPLDDATWPHDTLVEFDYMEDGDAPAR